MATPDYYKDLCFWPDYTEFRQDRILLTMCLLVNWIWSISSHSNNCAGTII